MTATFGKEFRILRKKKGKTIADVAEALGISVGQLSNIERGKARPFTDYQCATVALYLKCSHMDMVHLAQQEHRVWDRAEKLAKTLVARAQTMPDWMVDALEKLINGPIEERQEELKEVADFGVEPEVRAVHKLKRCMCCHFNDWEKPAEEYVKSSFDPFQEKVPDGSEPVKPSLFVKCPNCGACGPDWLCDYMAPVTNTEEAIEAWNWSER